MSGTRRRQPWTRRAAAALVTCVVAAASVVADAGHPRRDGSSFQEAPQPDAALLASLAEGFAKVEGGLFEDARAIFERALALAAAEGNLRGEAEAYRGLGRVRSSQRDFASGREAFERALALFERAGNDEGVGRVWNHLGADAYSQSRPAEARQCYDRALEAFRKAGLAGDEARVLRNLVFLPDRSLDEKLQLIESAVDRARLAGARSVEGLSLHTWSDLLFVRNDYAGAMTKLEAALPLLETSGSARDLARLYTSFGRLFRVHGDPARALTYYERALDRQRAVRDLTGEIQTLNAIALALSVLKRDKEAAARYEDALSLARSTGSPAEVGFILQQFGVFHVDYGRYARGAALLEEALTLRPSPRDRASALAALADAYKSLGRPAAAGAAADQAVAAAGESGDLEIRWNAHATRAEVELDAGHIQAALDDAREGLRLGERLRSNLLPADPFKLGFAERRRYYFDFAVSLMMQAGHVEEALAASEQGRARAFLDLLASQQVDARPADRAELTLLTTGAAPDAERWARADPELKSFVAAEAPSIDALRDTAVRLSSTVVSYWVTPTATFAWVLTPDGLVRGCRIAVPARRLAALVQSTWTLPSESPPPIQRGAGSQPAARQDRLAAGGQVAPSYRELYDLLVRPVRRWLPRGDGSLLTIVPHGPLLRLSFAALQNERGRYLLEGYRLHYTPALSVLQFTARKKRPGRDERLLLVASPSPSGADASDRLEPLPGAKREADAIARVSRGASLRVLAGAEAREARIRENAGAWTTIHFAVHGIVSDDRPLASYLALAGGSRDAADDGRLTAGEIYGLDLRADLVVLSACRTAGGRVTGDGIVGLTRAFIYAGAASVVASVWDLIDETTPQLFEAFYAARGRGEPASAALRASQLQMLRALRAGSVAVPTAAGRFVVPEHPSIWGGLQLWGEP